MTPKYDKPTILEALERASGVRQQEIHRIWEEVQANQHRLESCLKHNFVALTGKVPIKYRCSNCHGIARASDVSWYRLGLEHAKR